MAETISMFKFSSWAFSIFFTVSLQKEVIRKEKSHSVRQVLWLSSYWLQSCKAERTDNLRKQAYNTEHASGLKLLDSVYMLGCG